MSKRLDDSLPEWTDEERALLRSADRDRPSSRSLPAALAALGIGSAIASSAAGAQATAAVARAGVAAAGNKWGGIAAISKWIAVAAAGGMIVTGGVVLLRPSAAPNTPAHAAHRSVASTKSVAAPRIMPTASAAPTQAESTEAAHPSALGVKPRANSSASKRQAPSQPDIRLEIAALDAARTSLRAGNATETLATLDHYNVTFAKTGALRVEATALRIEALVLVGDRVRAVALAREFLSSHPQSPYAARVRALTEVQAKSVKGP